MLTYTFSRREKILIVILSLLLVTLGWYRFVYVETTEEIERMDAEIQQIDANIEIESVKVKQLNRMRDVVELREAQGAKKTPIPAYDNLTALMRFFFNDTATTESYTLSFDELDTESSEYVQRGVGMQFGCSSYEAAEAVVNQIADGTYPCVIDKVAYVDSSSTGTVRTSGSNVTVTMHVIFFEEPQS